MRKRLAATISVLALGLVTARAQADSDFDTFRQQFRIDAAAAGVDPTLYDREMATAQPLAVILERNDNQPEFNRPMWAYVDGATSAARIKGGQEGYAAEKALLSKIEDEYGVAAEVVVAIWGMESSYGRIMGDHDIVSALATLGFQGRRQSFGRTQLIAALKILQSGAADRDELKGSWAGAMGQTQFIPTTYIEHAVDHDGDGHKDLWSDRGDVFASTAHYLAQSGWREGVPWGFEVKLPAGFDFAHADAKHARTAGDWLALGVEAAKGSVSERIDLNERISIILPAGARGPAFAITNNFRAILRYNNSTAYALGVSFLSDAVAGRDTSLAQDWPRDDRPLTLAERKSLQQALSEKGYAPGPVDGIVGAGTRAALRAWQKDQGMPADGYASAVVLARLLEA
ncbi:lytic murein transglycosylase [Parvularcula dongshanensis]|uniref:Membrane-bound lytic murein transglycosylase B n=1 Tax=Parvularcula dongshanensis TaxID=1173995 RepID=A0A840I183_9PROT|nr:lytic murein transglycosylase [Parvularcula dongshanensis]MBB4658806.1 membrane-bound lytic murein transglycosylase B [Parvularcula dongshanensis]